MISSFTGSFAAGMRNRPKASLDQNSLIVFYDASNKSSYSGTGTTFSDLSGGGRNGTIYNSPTFTYPYFTWTSSDYIETPDLDQLITSVNESHTVEMWVYPTGNGVLLQYCGQATPNTGYHHSTVEIVSGQVEFGLWNGSGISSTGGTGSIALNEWHQVVVTYNGTQVRGYIDGEFVGSVNVSWDSPMNTGKSAFHMIFGYQDSTSQGDGTSFDGRLGLMRVYNRSLSLGEIRQNYNFNKYTFTSSLQTVSFTTTGWDSWRVPAGTTSVEYLIVGAGGGGGNGYDNAGGGGGAGGMVLSGVMSVVPYQNLSVYVGSGGVGGANTRANLAGSAGQDSIFAKLTAFGGGGGLGSRTGGGAGAAQNGSVSAPTGGSGNGGGRGGNGGGGATGSGGSTTTTTGASGGNGFSSDITGSSITYGVGGSGANSGVYNGGGSGTTNRGNGGNGGGSPSFASRAGGQGGSGIVILKYFG